MSSPHVHNSLTPHELHLLEVHRLKLLNIKPSVDNKPPKIHIANTSKKEYDNRIKNQKIKKENLLLLEKMSRIMNHKEEPPATIDNKKAIEEARRRKMESIEKENEWLFSRISNKTPYYNYAEWEAEHDQNQKKFEKGRAIRLSNKPKSLFNLDSHNTLSPNSFSTTKTLPEYNTSGPPGSTTVASLDQLKKYKNLYAKAPASQSEVTSPNARPGTAAPINNISKGLDDEYDNENFEKAEKSSRSSEIKHEEEKNQAKKSDKTSYILLQKKEEETKRKATEDARKREELAKIRKERVEAEVAKRDARAKEDEAAKKKLADDKEAKRLELEAKRELIRKDREAKQKKAVDSYENAISYPDTHIKTTLSPKSLNHSVKVSVKHSPRKIYKGGFEISHKLLIISITDDGLEWTVSAYDNSNSQEYSLKIRSCDIDQIDGDTEVLAENLLSKLSLESGILKYSH